MLKFFIVVIPTLMILAIIANAIDIIIMLRVIQSMPLNLVDPKHSAAYFAIVTLINNFSNFDAL